MIAPEEQHLDAPSVLLLSLPWTSQGEPSLGLSLLKAVLDRQGIRCRILHLELFLLEHLQAETYESLSRVSPLNEFLFSGPLDPDLTNAQQRCLRQKVWDLVNAGLIDTQRFGGTEGMVATLLHLRNEVIPAWLHGWADEIARHEATLVGFTCMFDQTIASLALARLVRERASNKMLVLGGYAVRSPTAQMVLRSCPWIDAVCAGEGEVSIVQLARATVGEIPLEEVQGIFYRAASGEPVSTAPPPIINLDENPAPNFDDFFADVRRLSEEFMVDVIPLNLPIENSRGCWWGAKSHCVFCGINRDDLAYRFCDAGSVLANMKELRHRYGIDSFRFNDFILPNQYFDTLLPELARLGRPYRLGAEIKANITEKRFALLAQAGFIWVQPGIESFSSNVLSKMHKGVTAAQNIHTLLLGRRYNMQVHYNLLYGLPDDDADEYERMVAILPRLLHLDPPAFCLPVQITRFAPLQARPEDFGIDRADPDPGYELLFSRDYLDNTGFSIADYCYYFERPFNNSVRLQSLYSDINKIVARWKTEFAEKTSWLYSEDNELTIHDRRGVEETIHRLDAATAKVLRACKQPVSMHELCKAVLRDAVPNAVYDIVDALDSLGLIFRDGEQLISLVMTGQSPRPDEKDKGVLPDST